MSDYTPKDLVDKIRQNGERLIDHPNDQNALAAMYCEVNYLRKNPGLDRATEKALNVPDKGTSFGDYIYGLFFHSPSSDVTFRRQQDGRLFHVETERDGKASVFSADDRNSFSIHKYDDIDLWDLDARGHLDKKPDCKRL